MRKVKVVGLEKETTTNTVQPLCDIKEGISISLRLAIHCVSFQTCRGSNKPAVLISRKLKPNRSMAGCKQRAKNTVSGSHTQILGGGGYYWIRNPVRLLQWNPDMTCRSYNEELVKSPGHSVRNDEAIMCCLW